MIPKQTGQIILFVFKGTEILYAIITLIIACCLDAANTNYMLHSGAMAAYIVVAAGLLVDKWCEVNNWALTFCGIIIVVWCVCLTMIGQNVINTVSTMSLIFAGLLFLDFVVSIICHFACPVTDTEQPPPARE